MSLEVARNLSVPDLPHVLDEKLSLEYAGLRESHLPPVVSLGSHVGISWFCHLILKECRGGFLQLNVNPAGRKSRSQSTRYSETHLLLSEPAAAGEQATARDDFSNCSTCPQQVRYRYTPTIVLTHVCRYWREFIISTPWNWTLISSRDKGLPALSLKRSKAAPLKLHLQMGEIRGVPEFSDLIMPYTRNAETLQAEGILSVEELMQKLSNFPQSMPNL